MEDNNELNSNEYLEMANHAKEMVEEAQAKMDLYKKQNIELKKNLISIYGAIRILDHFTCMDTSEEVNMYVEFLRGYMSDICENFIS